MEVEREREPIKAEVVVRLLARLARAGNESNKVLQRRL